MSDKPLINILIRTSNRPAQFKKCIDSIINQDYPEIRIIVGYDNEAALRYIPKGLETVFVSADRDLPFYYDCYIQQLMEYVNDGYIYILDDDDFITNNNSLSQLNLIGNGLIVQLQRYNNIVPKDLNFKAGGIGFPCLIIHHSLKNVSKIHGNGQGDYYWIRELLHQFSFSFSDIILTTSPGRGRGICSG